MAAVILSVFDNRIRFMVVSLIIIINLNELIMIMNLIYVDFFADFIMIKHLMIITFHIIQKGNVRK